MIEPVKTMYIMEDKYITQIEYKHKIYKLEDIEKLCPTQPNDFIPVEHS